MSDKEKIISSLEKKGLLDDSSVNHLRTRLKRKLKAEEDQQEKEFSSIKDELTTLQRRLSF